MGQRLGKATLLVAADPFTNLPRKAIAHLWQVFNDIADGFGISVDELVEICADLKDELNVSRLAIIEKSTALFEVLDTDRNGLIDALEFISTIAALSGMKLLEVLEFVLTSYDFDGVSTLTVDEVTLALKSVSAGLCKVSGLPAPREELIEQLVSTMFSEQTASEVTDSTRLRINLLAERLAAHPDIRCWYSFFGNVPQAGLQQYNLRLVDTDYDTENQPIERSGQELDGIEWDIRCKPSLGEITNEENSGWLAAIAMLSPMAYSNVTLKKLPPEASLEPEWVYGYQSEQCRNNLRYNFQGHVVYNVGKYAVVYNFNGHTQRIFSGHTEEILCLAIHPDGQYIATGEAGPKPRVCVWHSVTKEIAFMDRSFHKDSVVQIEFSLDGKLLAAIGNDKMHRLSVYRWAENVVLFTTPVDIGQALCCSFLLDGTVAVGGDSYLYYWSKAPEGYLRRRGNFSRYAPLQPITALAHIGTSDTLVSGTASGQLFLWTDRNCVRNVKAHDGTVNSLYSCSHGLVSGGRDHRVRLWTHKLEPGAAFDMSSFGITPSIRSACLSADGTSILVGTKGANIYEVSAVDGSDLRGGPVVSGHYTGKLNCMATHPSKHEFVTVGEDRRLRVWDMETRTLLKMATFDADVLTVAYSPTGDAIALGLGGDPMLAKCGAYVVINEEDMQLIHEARDSTTPICLVKYSPEGETLAVAAADGAVYLYAVLDEFELIGRCVRHTTPVTHLDFSSDGEWIRTNSLAKEICFFNADDASLQSNLPAMRDVLWSTWTSIYNWHLRSAHRTAYKGEAVTQVHSPSSMPNYIACGTNYGFIKLHSFPCVPDDSECHRFPAHAGNIACLRFSFDEKRLISVGEHDRCIVQWKAFEFEEKDVVILDLPESEDFALEAREGSDLGEDFFPEGSVVPDGVLNASLPTDPKTLASSAVVDTWLESVVAPTYPPKQNTNIPDLSLRLEYAYGFRSQDMRNSVRYTKNGEVAYVLGSLGVVINRSTKSQRFFQRHTDAITSFATSRDGTYVATGQMGHEPFVAVWDSNTCRTLATIPDLHSKSVSNLAFSFSSNLLATVGLDEDHTISIYDWRSGMLVSRAYGGSAHVLDIAFSEDDLHVVSCGIKEIRVWSNIMSRTPTYVKPALGEIGQVQPYLTCRYFAGNPTVGTADGNLYMFVDNALKTAVKAHDAPVATMAVNLQGNSLVTGGKDGAVRIWNVHLECTKEIPIGAVYSSNNPKVRSVAFSADGNNIVIGTRGSEILEVAVRSGALVGKPLVHGHGCRELWGLATHPTKDEFITSGDDSTIRVWDAKSYTIIKTIKVDTASRAIAYSPDGKSIVVGFGYGKRIKGKGQTKEGAYVVFAAGDMKIVHEGKDSNEPIRVARYSPDSNTLALGSEDANIYIYNAKDFYTKRFTISAHKAPVMFIDFTVDGNFISSVDLTRRISFSDMSTGQVVPSPATLREAKWSTWSSPVGWPVQGLWICQPDGVTPSAAMRSWGGALLAAGTTGGTIVVAHNPCPERPGYIRVSGHSGPISQVGWLAGDHTIISIGQKDHCILQWKCVFDTTRESGDEGGLSCEDSEVDRDGGHEFKDSDIVRFTDNMGRVQQWATAISPPSAPEVEDTTPPNVTPSIDFVHGTRLGDSRQTLLYNDDGHIVYIAVNFGVVYDRDNQLQRIYKGHSNGLISLAVDPLGKIAASGELHSTPELHLWDARTAEYIMKFRGLHRRGITSLAFSGNGEYLISLGQDVMHSVVILRSPTSRWHDGHFFCSTSVSPQKMLWSLYMDSNEFPIVIGGSGILYFFRPSGKSLERVRGVFGKRKKLQPVLCGVEGEVDESVSSEKTLLTGTVTGHIYVWNQQRVTSTVTAHDGPIYAITKLRQGYATAGKEGLVKLWSNKLQLVHTYNIRMFSPQPFGTACHSLKCNLLGTRIVVGMKTNEVYEISLPTHSNMLLLEGHSYCELHGVDCNPHDGDEFATVGDDGILRVWSYRLRACLRRVSIEAAGRAISYFPDGKRIIVGMGGDPLQATKDGAFIVVDSKTLEILYEDRKAKLYLTDIKFSNSGEMIAMSSADGKIYLHLTENFSYLKTISTPSKNSIVNRIDFSQDGSLIRCCTNKDELFHFTVATGDIITSPLATRDTRWKTETCVYTFLSQGELPLSAASSFFPLSYLSSSRAAPAHNPPSHHTHTYTFLNPQDSGARPPKASMSSPSRSTLRRMWRQSRTKTARFDSTVFLAKATRKPNSR